MLARTTQASLFLCLASMLPAQQEPTDPTAPQQPPSPPQGETATPQQPDKPAQKPILVTARKWEEDPATVPQSLTVVDERTLHDVGLDNIRDAGFFVPNLFFNEFSARRLSFPTLRGLGSGQGDPAVLTYIDGVPQLTVDSTNLPLLDVERITFLRGPQGTLFGRNALGGVIQIESKRPADALEAELGVTFGNFGLDQQRLRASGPLAEDRAGFRLGLLRTQREGYTQNDFTGHDVDDKDQLCSRLSLTWTPDAHWECDLTFTGERARDGGFVLGDLQEQRRNPRHIDQDFEGIADRNLAGLSLRATRHGDLVDFTSVSALQDVEIAETSDFDFSALDGVRRRSEETQRSYYQELRLGSAQDLRLDGDTTAKWLCGVSGFVADSTRSAANDYRPGGAGILFPPSQVGVDNSSGEFDDWSLAAFGQATVTFWQQLELCAGLRYDYEHKRAALQRTFSVSGTVFSDVRQRVDDSFDELVPQASIGWHANQDLLLYGRAARGFKAGGFNLAAPTGQESFAPETSNSYEIGLKSAWLDQRLQLDFAVYQIDWNDMQLSLFDAQVGGYVTNAGAATSRGFEVEARVDAGTGLQLLGSFGLCDATFDRFTDSYGVDVSGQHLAYAPKTTANLGAMFSTPTGRNGRAYVACDWASVGAYYFDAANRQSERFDLLSLRAGLELGQLQCAFWVRNLLDQDYVQVAFQPSPADPTMFVGESGAPRTFAFELSYRF